MHRADNSKYLLYIEPKASERSENPIEDEKTKILNKIFIAAKEGTARYSDISCQGAFLEGSGYRGSHLTEYGETSTNKDYLLPNGMITNSLCVTYLKWYRNAIPESEMEKVDSLCKWAKENGFA